jgi:hypothetical protein
MVDGGWIAPIKKSKLVWYFFPMQILSRVWGISEIMRNASMTQIETEYTNRSAIVRLSQLVK